MSIHLTVRDDVDFEGLCEYLGRLEARGRYNGEAVTLALQNFGVPARLIPAWYSKGEPSGMVISGDVARYLGAEPGSYGGWGFQHSANIRAIAALA